MSFLSVPFNFLSNISGHGIYYNKMERNLLEKDRLLRLRKTTCVFGEPDLISSYKITTINSFLTQKKTIDCLQNFVSGLNFPTTAHFSSFVNQKIREWRKDEKNESVYRFKLAMFDAFKKIDVQIEINVPGSVEIRGFGLNGQPIKITEKGYEEAYYSSILRSMWANYTHPNLQIHSDLQSYELMTQFIKNFIPFALENPIPVEISVFEQNIGIEILIQYLKDNRFFNLLRNVSEILKSKLPEREYLLSLEIKEMKGEFKQIIRETASRMFQHKDQNYLSYRLKQFQLRSLAKFSKNKQFKILAENLVREGLEDLSCWEAILSSYIDMNEDREFMKYLNIAANFIGENYEAKEQKIRKIVLPEKIEDHTAMKRIKSPNISNFPEYCFRFDEEYLNSESRLNYYRELLEKNEKQKPTLDLLSRIDFSRKKEKYFQKHILEYEKNRSWDKLLLLRNKCFWLENDYNSMELVVKRKNAPEQSYRFLNESINRAESFEETKKIDELNMSFDGEFSDSDSESCSEKEPIQAPFQSKRVATKRVTKELQIKKTEQIKVLCHYSLENLFLNVFNDLNLSKDLDKWMSKLNLDQLSNLSAQKRQLLALVCIKKAYFQKKLLKYRKVEETLKIARKCSTSMTVGLVTCYSLAKLYLQHDNVRGVEFYTIEIVKMFWALGIEAYDILPEWAREFIPFIIKKHGKEVINKLQGPLNKLVSLWLKIQYPKAKAKTNS